MDEFNFRNGVLHCEAIDLREVAQRFDTPLYVYSRKTLLDHYDRCAAAFAPLNATICFSVKSCHNLAILELLRRRGSAFDVVSGGELQRVLEIGADPSRIAFAGVGKSDAEINQAVQAGIGWFNVESEGELGNVASIASAAGKIARVALRVNPDVDPQTHVYTTTGKRETKFGVDLVRARQVFRDFRGRSGLDLSGVHLHLGSPVNRIDAYAESVGKALELIEELKGDGFAMRAINIGGGFGAHYQHDEAPPAHAYAERIVPLLRHRDLAVLLEPGRSIAANGGILLTRVLYTKASGDRQFVIVDAAMTELIRPALYGAFHFAWPVAPRDGAISPARGLDVRSPGSVLVDIVGPVCESGDFLAKDRWLPPVSRGDLICIFATGAYGSVMSSQYNSRPRAAEVLVDGASVRLVRRRETYDDLVQEERLIPANQDVRKDSRTGDVE
jgi:diaminopimelate decarboxylase